MPVSPSKSFCVRLAMIIEILHSPIAMPLFLSVMGFGFRQEFLFALGSQLVMKS
jgi:hypothetical protein